MISPSTSRSARLRRVLSRRSRHVRRALSFRSKPVATRIGLGAAYFAAALLLVGAAWLVVTGLLARAQLDDARAELPELRTALTQGNFARAHHLVGEIRSHADRAHSLTTGPAWYVASSVPLLGAPVDTSRTIAEQVDVIGDNVLPAVLALADQVEASKDEGSGRSVDLAAIARVQPQLDEAAQVAAEAARQIDLTSGSWLPMVSSARADLAHQLGQLNDELVGADRAIRLMIPMLGNAGPQRYFIGFLNEAEARGLGGIPGAFAIATASDGHLSFTHFGADDELLGVHADVDLGTDFNELYSALQPTEDIRNSDSSPDFAADARIWASMWERKSGQHIDGAIAIDPTALSYLLRATGPATLRDGTQLTADNVVELFQKQQYQLFPADTPKDNLERKAYLVGIAKALSTQLTTKGSAASIVRALSHAAGERRLVIWSADPTLERQLVTSGWSGSLEPHGPTVAGFVVQNVAGSKLDYYLSRSMTYTRTDCDGGAQATFTITNNAPKSGLPPYVTTRLDPARVSAKPGDNADLITYYMAGDARLGAVLLDGHAAPVTAGREGDLIAVSVRVEMPAGATRTITVNLTEPTIGGSPTVLRQPGVSPLRVDLRANQC